MPSEYRALVAKVAQFTDAAAQRRHADMACSEGCSSCCHAWLSVSLVEADALRAGLAQLPAEARERVAARGRDELSREARGEREPRCALLGDDERCEVYDSRPLVCRTQGHALRYPPGLIPAAAIARKTANGEETWCPLNYHAAEPRPEDVLDAERVDQILAVVAARYEAVGFTASPAGRPREPAATLSERLTLSQLAADEEVRNDPTARATQPEARDR